MVADIQVQAQSLLRVRTALPAYEIRKKPAGAWTGPLVQLGSDMRALRDVAYVEAAEEDGMLKSGWRRLTVWADADKREALVGVDTEVADGQRAVYRVVDPSGTVLARVERVPGSVSGFRRTHWSVGIVGGPTLHAVKGSVFGWCVWWALSPLWAVLALVSILGGDVARMPLKTVFRGPEGAVLTYSGVNGNDHDFWIDGTWPDPRVVIGLAVLHNTHLSWRDRP